MTNLSMSLVNMLYNLQLMKYAGENGVAAYGVIMYVNFIFVGVFIGYAFGSAPIIGYHYGAGNHMEMTKRGFAIYSISFIVMGLNIYASSFFTALGNGFISALISFLRTLLFQVVCVLVLPLIWELDGIWMAIVVAEALALAVSFVLLAKNKKKYGY